ncbi:MAG: hypothetical protein Q7R45_07310 [Sulfuricaulis sp.]|nr:hypothetical protein [Sulfuricaulis sp.]
MPLIDTQNLFSDAQAVTGNEISDNVIDLLPQAQLGSSGHLNAIRDIGAGSPLYLFIVVTTTMDSTEETATLDVTLESDSTPGLETSATVHWTSELVIAEATLVAGYWIAKGVPLPPGNYERYLGLRYNPATADFTTGKITAWLSTERFDERTYEAGSRSGIN